MSAPRPRSDADLRYRRGRAHGCWDHLLAAPLWPAYDVNLGTLLRTTDAVGACLAVPWSVRRSGALAKGNTLRTQPCVHWIRGDPVAWLRRVRS